MLRDGGAAEKDGQEGCEKCYGQEYTTDSDADNHVVDAIPMKR